MKKLLSLLGSVAMVGTASATVIACGNKKKAQETQNPIEVARKSLAAKIEEAQGMINTSRTPDEVTEALRKANETAKEILNKKETTEAELINALNDLTEAVKKFQKANNELAEAKEALTQEIATASRLLEGSKKEVAVNTALKSAMDKASQILITDKISKAQIETAIANLRTAIEEFKKQPDLKNPRELLQERINDANRLIVLGEKSKEAIEKLKAEVAKAQVVVTNEKATDEQLFEALNALQKAIEEFNNSKDGIEGLRYQLQQTIFQSVVALIDAIYEGNKGVVELGEFETLIKESQIVCDKSQDENELKTTLETLQKALDEFRKSF